MATPEAPATLRLASLPGALTVFVRTLPGIPRGQRVEVWTYEAGEWRSTQHAPGSPFDVATLIDRTYRERGHVTSLWHHGDGTSHVTVQPRES